MAGAYQCQLCPESYDSREELDLHVRRKHRGLLMRPADGDRAEDKMRKFTVGDKQ